LRQQYIIDAYVTVEQTHLNYLRLNKKKLRADLYQGLQDAIVANDNNVQNYQDAMAICRWARCSDAFVTFTCNPQWPEIKRVLMPG
jgi:hypothetical protein